MDIEKLQNEWDSFIARYPSAYVGGAFVNFLGKVETMQQVEGADFGEKVEWLKTKGIKRLPRFSGDSIGWWRVFKKLPISAWLARAVPGSFNKLHGKTEEEKIAFLQSCRFKRLKAGRSRQNAIRKAQTASGGAVYKVSVRDRDKRTSWSTVK